MNPTHRADSGGRTRRPRGRRRPIRWAWLGAGLVSLLWAAPAGAGPDPIEPACLALERERATGCQLARQQDGILQLTTRHVVGTGAKARVAALEERFCESVVDRGVAGRVVRLSSLPGQDLPGAKMEWLCGLQPVSAPPRWLGERGGVSYRR